MFDMFGGLSGIFLFMKIAGYLIVLVAVATCIYAVKTVLTPTLSLLKWLFPAPPGSQSAEVFAGISHGLRLLVWMAIVGLVLWFITGV